MVHDHLLILSEHFVRWHALQAGQVHIVEHEEVPAAEWEGSVCGEYSSYMVVVICHTACSLDRCGA